MDDLSLTLKQEHELIIRAYEASRDAWTKRNMEACKEALSLLQNLLKDHHQSEYTNLFSKLLGNPLIQAGGPFCIYFFDFYMANRPFSSTLKRINQIRDPGKKMLSIEIPETLKCFFDQKSMLCIPIEEHLSQEALVMEMKRALVDWNPKNTDWFMNSLEDLEELLKRNVEKEETCLWTIARAAGL